MLLGMELSRRRRAHRHRDVVAQRQGARGGTDGELHHQGDAPAQALAARIRLEEKLRGAAPPASLSRWSRLMRERDGSATSRQQQQQQQVLETNTELRPDSVTVEATTSHAELERALSNVDLCAVCLNGVREQEQGITRLPCSHKFHSDCVLPWLAIHPDCPCCRTPVPSVDALS